MSDGSEADYRGAGGYASETHVAPRRSPLADTVLDATPKRIIPAILQDASLTSEDRARYLQRYIDSREEAMERKLKYIEAAAAQQTTYMPMPNPMAAPGYGGYYDPRLYPGAGHHKQGVDIFTRQGMINAAASPFTTFKIGLEWAISLFSWFVIYKVFTFAYKLL